MLAKRFRLNITSFFRNHQSMRKYSAGTLSLMMKSAIDGSHVAVSVPKSLDKRAVYRNRTKRIIMEIIQKKLPAFKSFADLLIKSRKILKKEDRPMVEKEVDELLRKAGLL